MKILIIGFWFPPANVIGAVRLGKLARYLDRHGHDVRVLTADVAEDRSLPLEVPPERVVYAHYVERTNWLDILVRALWAPRNDPPPVSGDNPVPATGAAVGGSLRQLVRRHYYGMLHLPDMRVDWLKSALPAGARLCQEWRPDVIFASAPPYTGFILASRLARRFGIPWIADFRDLWVDNPYYSAPVWRRPIDAVLERLTLRNAAGLVTVSPIWAEQLRQRHGKSAEVIYNGYAEEDFPEGTPRASHGPILTIRYLGSIYPTFRDPSALFAALELLPEAIRDYVIVEFYCDAGDIVLAAAAEHHVVQSVTIKPRVPYRCALALQMEADILLLLQSTEQRDEGNIPAKLFEYFYARRPILFIGYEHGVAAQLVRDRGAGLVSNAPEQIRDQLQAWIADKQAGRLTRLDPSVSRGLGRDEQFCNLERFLGKLLHVKPGQINESSSEKAAPPVRNQDSGCREAPSDALVNNSEMA
jgi:glycosyltransferase involved in cell wall biosynthesis